MQKRLVICTNVTFGFDLSVENRLLRVFFLKTFSLNEFKTIMGRYLYQLGKENIEKSMCKR